MADRYEVLILTVPEITQDETKQLETELDKLITGNKGSVISFERWGKYKLTYPVRGNDYGVYFLVRYEVPTSITKKINELFKIKLSTFVMRHMVSALKPGESLEYQRPKSLEETPASRDMDSFLKENKMEGLLSSVEGKEASKTSEPSMKKDTEQKETETESAPAEQ